MNENLDLCLILKDCPKDAKLYCTFLGDVLFSKIEDNKIFVHTNYAVYSFYSDGKFTCDGECVLFPSKDQRDWSKFKIPIKRFNPKEFKPFDKVLVRDDYDLIWNPTIFRCLGRGPSGCIVYDIGTKDWIQCIPYNKDTSHLANTSDSCPEYYKWWKK